MVAIRNKEHHGDFDFFDTYKDALYFLEKMPKEYREKYEIVRPQRNPLDMMKVR